MLYVVIDEHCKEVTVSVDAPNPRSVGNFSLTGCHESGRLGALKWHARARGTMAVISVQAQHGDGFSSELLRWSLEVRNGVGQAEAEWCEYGAPQDKGRRAATFAFPRE